LGYGLKGNHVGGYILQIGSTRRERYLDLRRGFTGGDSHHAVVRNGAEFLGEYDILGSVVEVVLFDMAFVEDELHLGLNRSGLLQREGQGFLDGLHGIVSELDVQIIGRRERTGDLLARGGILAAGLLRHGDLRSLLTLAGRHDDLPHTGISRIVLGVDRQLVALLLGRHPLLGVGERPVGCISRNGQFNGLVASSLEPNGIRRRNAQYDFTYFKPLLVYVDVDGFGVTGRNRDAARTYGLRGISLGIHS